MEGAGQAMDMSADMSPDTDGSGAGEADFIHRNEMGSVILPTTNQGTMSNLHQRPRDALDDRIDELEKRLAALTVDRSPSKSSNASFRTAREQLSPKKLSQDGPGKSKGHDLLKKPNPASVLPRGSRRQSLTTAQSSSRPTTLHRASTRPSTRRNSTAPTSQAPSASSSKREGRASTSTRPSAFAARRAATGPDLQGLSASSSRRSSFMVNPPAGAQTSRPARPNRRNNTSWPPPTFISDGRQALQSLQAFSDLRHDVYSALQAEERLKSSSLPTLPRPPTADTTTAPRAPPADDPARDSPQDRREYANHVPAANIDWTLPSTRRRAYDEIDSARRGLRGLMRRVTPRILRGTGPVGFHDDGRGSDAGTVRRFRMDVADGDGAGDDDDDGIVVARKHWWKLDRKRAKGGGQVDRGGMKTSRGF